MKVASFPLLVLPGTPASAPGCNVTKQMWELSTRVDDEAELMHRKFSVAVKVREANCVCSMFNIVKVNTACKPKGN